MRKIQEDAAIDIGHKYNETNQLKKEQRQNIFKEKECLNKKSRTKILSVSMWGWQRGDYKDARMC